MSRTAAVFQLDRLNPSKWAPSKQWRSEVTDRVSSAAAIAVRPAPLLPEKHQSNVAARDESRFSSPSTVSTRPNWQNQPFMAVGRRGFRKRTFLMRCSLLG